MTKGWIACLLLIALNGAHLFGAFPGEVEFVQTPQLEHEPSPWFTGPLLTPSGHVVPAGMINVEPYAFVNIIDGGYDENWNSFSTPTFYNNNYQMPIFLGLTQWMDILLIGQASWNKTQGVSTLVVNDFIAELDFQVIEDTQENKLPGLKLYIQETFPLGKYDERDPNRLGTDIGGQGTYNTVLGFVITRLFHLSGMHYLSLRLNGLWGIASPVRVKGVNAYGGAPDTRGRVKPGQRLAALFGAEYNMTRNWALAIDAFGTFSYQTKFSGKAGAMSDGTPAVVGGPESFQFSLAPAIEYNVNAGFGIIAGAWFTLAGQNSERFRSAVLAINYFGPLPHTPRNRFRTSGGGGSP